MGHLDQLNHSKTKIQYSREAHLLELPTNTVAQGDGPSDTAEAAVWTGEV